MKYVNGRRVDCSQYEGVVVKAETIVSFGRRLRFSLGIYENILFLHVFNVFESSLNDVQKTFSNLHLQKTNSRCIVITNSNLYN